MAEYIPTRNDCESLLRSLSDNDSILRMTTLKAIWTALLASTHPSQTGTDTTTGSISVGSATGEQIEKLFGELQAKGLKVNNSGSTFTVTL